MNSLKALNFVGDEHDYYQYWKKETKLAENKILKIEFHLEEYALFLRLITYFNFPEMKQIVKLIVK